MKELIESECNRPPTLSDVECVERQIKASLDLLEVSPDAIAFGDKSVLLGVSIFVNQVRKLLQSPLGFEEWVGKVSDCHDRRCEDALESYISESDVRQYFATLSTYDAEKEVAVPIEDLDRILVLCDEVVDGHRDRQSSNYNECDLPGEQCKWCADYLKGKAMLKASKPEDA